MYKTKSLKIDVFTTEQYHLLPVKNDRQTVVMHARNC